MKVIISGGGTGGHIFPAIAIANALKLKDPSTDILFVGANGRMEMEKVPLAGYRIVGLDIVGLQRRLTLKNLSFPFKLWKSLKRAKKIVKDFNPDIVVGVGGYASGPTLRMANKLGIPTLIQEQNSYPGITNKILAKKVRKICVAYEGMEQFFPKEKIVFTGNPIRQDIMNLDQKRAEAAAFFELDASKKTILVIGGSLGARTINNSFFSIVPKLLNLDIQLIWQTGKNIDQIRLDQLEVNNKIKILPFISRMDLAYSLADIIVSRAGAISISELCLVGKPTILIPSPNVAEDHQTKNAMALVNRDAALLVPDSAAQTELYGVLMGLVSDEQKQKELSTHISKLAKMDAAKDIADIAVELTKK